LPVNRLPHAIPFLETGGMERCARGGFERARRGSGAEAGQEFGEPGL